MALNLGELRRAGLARVLIPIALFEFGNLATTLLILRATELLHTGGRDLTAATSLAVLLYAAHNGAATVAALGGGHLIDRFDPRAVFAAGAAVYLGGYVIFAMNQHGWGLLLTAFLLAGVGIGFAETAQSTVIARGLPARLRANGFGVLGLTQAAGDLGGTVVAGVLWSVVSPTVAFLYAAAWMAAHRSPGGCCVGRIASSSRASAPQVRVRRLREDPVVEIFSVAGRQRFAGDDPEGALSSVVTLRAEEERARMLARIEAVREVVEMGDEHDRDAGVDHRADHLTADLGSFELIGGLERLVAQQQAPGRDLVGERAHPRQLLVELAARHRFVLLPHEVGEHSGADRGRKLCAQTNMPAPS